MNDGSGQFAAGAAVRHITPQGHCFLSGYPRVPRVSTGVHDELLCSALYFSSRGSGALILSVDLIFVSRELSGRVRERIAAATGIAAATIAIAATHTHSGPVTVRHPSDRGDHVAPEPDCGYLEFLVGRMVEAGCEAIRSARAAEVGVTSFPVGGIGSHHHDPLGPSDWEATLLVAREAATKLPIGAFFIYAMHPAVLGGDSTQLSGDFPHYFREFLWDVGTLPRSAPILFLNGASGDQSPRYLVRANTFEEAQRLGDRLGRFAQAAALGIMFFPDVAVEVRSAEMTVVPRVLPDVSEGRRGVARAHARLAALRAAQASRPVLPPAQHDALGAEATLELARASLDGGWQSAIADSSPAEIQVLCIGAWNIVFWPGEFFVEFGLELKARCARTWLVTLANGELQGAIVTEAAARAGLYEAGNAVFAPSNGRRFIEATMALLQPPNARSAP